MCCKPLHEDVIDVIAGQLRGRRGRASPSPHQRAGGRRVTFGATVRCYGRAFFERTEVVNDIRIARLLAGILLIILPTVMIGGVSILSLIICDPTYMENLLRQGSVARRTRACWRLAHHGARGAALRRRGKPVQCHEMARAGLDPDRRDPGPCSLLPIRAVARCHGPERAHLSRLCRRNTAGRRRARPRDWPHHASGTMMPVAIAGRLESLLAVSRWRH